MDVCSEARLVPGRDGGVYSRETTAHQDSTEAVGGAEDLPSSDRLQQVTASVTLSG